MQRWEGDKEGRRPHRRRHRPPPPELRGQSRPNTSIILPSSLLLRACCGVGAKRLARLVQAARPDTRARARRPFKLDALRGRPPANNSALAAVLVVVLVQPFLSPSSSSFLCGTWAARSSSSSRRLLWQHLADRLCWHPRRGVKRLADLKIQTQRCNRND